MHESRPYTNLERERDKEIYGKKKIQSNKEQIKEEKIKRQLVTVNWKTKRLYKEVKNKIEMTIRRILKT